MASITIADLSNHSEAFFKTSELKLLTDEEIIIISGGLSAGEGLGIGITVTGLGVGAVAVATGPVGWFVGGVIYGIGLGLSMYSGYLVGGGGGSSYLTALQ